MARLNIGQSRRDLNDELSNLNEAQKKQITGSFRALRASRTDTSVIQSTAHSKIVGGRECTMDSIMDSGCSFPITSTAVAEGIGAEIKPLKNKLEIIDASNQVMDIIGTIKMYIYNRVLGGRKLVEAAVIRSKKKETLISLDFFKALGPCT